MCSLGIKLQWEHGKKITYMLYDKSYKITYLLSPTNNNVMIRITSHKWNSWITVLIIVQHFIHKNLVTRLEVDMRNINIALRVWFNIIFVFISLFSSYNIEMIKQMGHLGAIINVYIYVDHS